ncbi:MAG: hypothetical protein GX916_02380 [Clostridiales bacterium]|jgi:hypothetical protein|nr:hypothetical protein [Clostridiales bacterium]
METVIVELTISAAGETVDLMLPAHVPLDAIMGELIRKLEQYMPSVMIDKEYPMLYNPETLKVLPRSGTLAAAGIHDGASLVIV